MDSFMPLFTLLYFFHKLGPVYLHCHHSLSFNSFVLPYSTIRYCNCSSSSFSFHKTPRSLSSADQILFPFGNIEYFGNSLISSLSTNQFSNTFLHRHNSDLAAKNYWTKNNLWLYFFEKCFIIQVRKSYLILLFSLWPLPSHPNSCNSLVMELRFLYLLYHPLQHDDHLYYA